MEINKPIKLKKGEDNISDPFLDEVAFHNAIAEFDKAVEKLKISGSDEDKKQANLIRQELVKYSEAFSKQAERQKEQIDKLKEYIINFKPVADNLKQIMFPLMSNSIENLSLSLSSITQNSLDVFSIPAMSEYFRHVAVLGTTNLTDIIDLLSPLKDYIESLPADEREEEEARIQEAIENNTQLQPQEQTEILRSIIPKIHIRPNNKLSNQITKDFLNQGEIELVVSNKKAKKEITTKAILTYGGDNITLTGDFDFLPYDMEVHDGVITLWEAGNIVFTKAMLYRAMNGQVKTEYINEQALNEVKKSLAKSRVININIDFTNEAKMYRKDITKAHYNNFLLIYDEITLTVGGQEVEAYRLLRKPILYEYAQISGQIISVPLNYLHTNKKISNTSDVITIRGYLLKQIEDMKSKSFNRNNLILYQGIYDTIKLHNDEHTDSMYKKKTLTARKQTKAILSHWVEEKYIHSFEEYKSGNTIIGLIIHRKATKKTPKNK